MQSIQTVLVFGTLAAATLVGVGSNLQNGILPRVQAHEIEAHQKAQSCSADTLKGGYGLTFQGFGTRAPVPAPIGAFILAAGVGVVNFDGVGSLTLVETTSFGGHIAPISTTGTYMVNADCTGSLDAPGAATWNFVIVQEGKRMMAINTIPGRVATVDLQKQ